MKTTNKWRLLSLTALAITLIFAGCNRGNIRPTDEDEDFVQKNTLAEDTYNDIQSIADQAGTDGALTDYKIGAAERITGTCATITKEDLGNGSEKITIDFGTTNCLCRDGKNRRGKIFALHTGKYQDAGTVINISFQDFFVNDNQIEGEKTITNMGANAAGHLVYHVIVSNGKITLASGAGVITWTADKYREWIEGIRTREWSDDTFLVWGTRTGTRASGESYTVSVRQETALLKKAACKWFVSGVAIITPSGKLSRTIDFGNGTCDDEATLTVGNRTRTIHLKR